MMNLLEKLLKEEEADRLFFYDTEFIEFPSTIDLISIGIVDNEGNEFYAVSNEFDLNKAEQDKWLRENVLSQLPDKSEWISREEIKNNLLDFLQPSEESPVELWAYYPAYDHVVLCWLFGRMIDLPVGMPMQTNDLRQLMNSMGKTKEDLPPESPDEHNALADARWTREAYRKLKGI